MILRFDKTLYSVHAIKQAIQEYSSIAEIDFLNSDADYICTIRKSRYSAEKTALEFSNYVLCLSVAGENIL